MTSYLFQSPKGATECMVGGWVCFSVKTV